VKIANAATDAGRPIPESAVPPELPDGLELYLSHFWELSTDRSIGFGCVGPIPWSILDKYARAHCDTDVELEDFVYYIRALDSEFMTMKNEEVKR